jgi:predicted RNA-binding Zn ribbon-like protein
MRPQQFDLDPSLTSGHPALEFTNTVSNHASGQPTENLRAYESLLELAGRIKLLGPGHIQALGRKAGRQPGEGARVLAQAILLREALYRIFVAVTRKKSPAGSDLAILNKLLRPAIDGAQLGQRAGRFELEWNVDQAALDAPLRLLALAGMDLLASEYCSRLGQCADADGCGWLFVDTTKNHSRRWCDISDCGNRAKQRRFQQRTRKLHDKAPARG